MKSPPMNFSHFRERSSHFSLEFSPETSVYYEALSIAFGNLSEWVLPFLFFLFVLLPLPFHFSVFLPNKPMFAHRITSSDRQSLVRFGVQILGLTSQIYSPRSTLSAHALHCCLPLPLYSPTLPSVPPCDSPTPICCPHELTHCPYTPLHGIHAPPSRCSLPPLFKI